MILNCVAVYTVVLKHASQFIAFVKLVFLLDWMF